MKLLKNIKYKIAYKNIAALLTASYVSLFSSNVVAQSVHELVGKALDYSPSIKAEKLRLDSIQEQKVQALNQRRPNIQLNSSYGISSYNQWIPANKSTNFRNQGLTPGNLSLVLSQPIFTGGRVELALREGQLRYAQQIAKIYALSLNEVQKTLEAYANVIRDSKIYEIRRDGVNNLNEQLNAAIAMRKAGLVSLTDVSQAETRLLGAKSQLEMAKLRLTASWTTLERHIGETNSSLPKNSIVMNIPNDLNEAIELAIKNNSELKIIRFNEDITRASAKKIETDYAPKLSLDLSNTSNFNINTNGYHTNDTQLTARLSIPLWNGGQTSSRIRATIAEADAYRFDALDQELQLKEKAIIAWQNIEVASKNIELSEKQVKSAQSASTGAKLELKIGTRTIIEALNQEQEVMDAQINLTNAKNDYLISCINLMVLIGIDPTGNISEKTRYNPELEPPNMLDNKKGIPTKWEMPFVSLYEILSPVDNEVKYKYNNLKNSISKEK